MQGSYNLWLVAGSYLVATLASYTALELASRVVASSGRAAWAWLAGGSVTMGVGIWSMHFIGMLAFRLPIRLVYDLPLTLLSVLPAVLSGALVLGLVRRGGVGGWRMALAAGVLGCGIAAMHYCGMAAIHISPPIAYDALLVVASVAVAVAIAYVALRLAPRLSQVPSRGKKGAVALVIGAAIAAMHYTGMAAAQFAPGAICTVTPSTIEDGWLAAIIGMTAVLMLMATTALAAYDARFTDRNARNLIALQSANDTLAGYFATMEEEKRIAKHLIDRLTSPSQAWADSVASRILPARYFSGDLVAVARTPGGTLHVLLADSTGHGLAAALGALPVVQPFYAMSAKGFAVGTIAREVNAKVGAMLPTGRFLAAIIASIDTRTGVICVWNGGIPACHVLDDQGRSVRRFASRHPPLGIIDDEQFDSSAESFHFDLDCQLVMVSDGLVEAENSQGQAFGEDGLLEVLARALPSVRLRALSAAVHGHLGYEQPHDDISIVVAECRLERSHTLAAKGWRLDGAPAATDNLVQITLGAPELKRADAVPALCNFLSELGLGGRNAPDLFVVLTELYNNALDHGLLELESSIKNSPDGFDAYLVERGRRLEQLRHGSIEIAIAFVDRGDQPSLKVSVRDSGHGFEYQPYVTVPLEQLSSKQHGRGISLVRSICTAVEYKDRGREVEVCLPLA